VTSEGALFAHKRDSFSRQLILSEGNTMDELSIIDKRLPTMSIQGRLPMSPDGHPKCSYENREARCETVDKRPRNQTSDYAVISSGLI
jgi:hypothetical protein